MNPLMTTNYVLSIISILLLGGFSVVHFVDRMLRKKAQAEYELSFFEKHQQIINEAQNDNNENDNNGNSVFIPLLFEHRARERLLSLCKISRSIWTFQYYFNLWTLQTFQPSVQIHFIGLRRLATELRPVRGEVIRCSERFALIDAGDRSSGYVLERVQQDLIRNKSVFAIYSKFYFESTSPTITGAIELPSNDERQNMEQPVSDKPLPSAYPELTSNHGQKYKYERMEAQVR